MAATDLTTLAAVKSYLGKTGTESDSELSALITQVSGAMRMDVSRDLVPVKTYNDNVNGNGKTCLFTNHYPIVAITAVTIGGMSVPAMVLPATTGCGRGYTFDDNLIELSGYCFHPGIRNVNLQYKSGFAVLAEAETINSTTYKMTAAQPYGNWNSDLGVTLADGVTAFTAISSGTPATGQYTISGGIYQFAAADTGKAVLLNYGYVPADLERACIEWVALRFTQKNHVGVDSKGMAGETAHYTKDVMPDTVLLTLEQYRRVLPI